MLLLLYYHLAKSRAKIEIRKKETDIRNKYKQPLCEKKSSSYFLSFDHRVNRWIHSGLENSQKSTIIMRRKKMAGPVKVIKKELN